MRLFFALRLSPSVAEALTQAQADLRRQGRGTFPPPENLHLTLAFLGETEALSEATAALAAIRARPFSLSVGGPPGHFDDVWWAGVTADRALKDLALSLQADLRRRGFSLEERPFRPHITLVRRWRGEAPQVSVPHAKMVVRQVSLFQSDLTGGRRVYTEVAHKALHQ